jgi:hypothetical protein
MMRASGSAQGVAVAPQPTAVPVVTSATLPAPAAMLRPPVVKSAVNVAPSVPVFPVLTSR